MHVTGVHSVGGSDANVDNTAGTNSGHASGTAQGVGLLTPTVATSVPKGFQLEYRQLPGNC